MPESRRRRPSRKRGVALHLPEPTESRTILLQLLRRSCDGGGPKTTDDGRVCGRLSGVRKPSFPCCGHTPRRVRTSCLSQLAGRHRPFLLPSPATSDEVVAPKKRPTAFSTVGADRPTSHRSSDRSAPRWSRKCDQRAVAFPAEKYPRLHTRQGCGRDRKKGRKTRYPSEKKTGTTMSSLTRWPAFVLLPPTNDPTSAPAFCKREGVSPKGSWETPNLEEEHLPPWKNQQTKPKCRPSDFHSLRIRRCAARIPSGTSKIPPKTASWCKNQVIASLVWHSGGRHAQHPSARKAHRSDEDAGTLARTPSWHKMGSEQLVSVSRSSMIRRSCSEASTVMPPRTCIGQMSRCSVRSR